jgi:integrase
MTPLRFSKLALEKLPAAPSGSRQAYSDTETSGLSLRVTANGIKTFVVYRKLAGRPVRVTPGRFPEVTVEQARRRATLEMAKLVDGRNPNAERKIDKLRTKTLSEVLEDYVAARKSLKASTAADFRKRLHELFDDWSDKPIASLSRDMIAKRHSDIGARSPSQANKGMRILRALFNFAIGAYEDADGRPIMTDNPVKRISHTRAWYRINPRRTLIEKNNLKPWFDAVLNLKSDSPADGAETVCDYLIFVLLTGLRREEAADLLWKNVDLAGKKFSIPDTDTKNSESHPKDHQRHSSSGGPDSRSQEAAQEAQLAAGSLG